MLVSSSTAQAVCCQLQALGRAARLLSSLGMVDSGAGGSSAPAQAPRRRSGPKSRTSPYVGVTQYKRTGRWCELASVCGGLGERA